MVFQHHPVPAHDYPEKYEQLWHARQKAGFWATDNKPQQSHNIP